MQKNKYIHIMKISASPIWAFCVLAMPQAKQVILSDVKDHSGPYNLQYHLSNTKSDITFNNK